APHITDHELPSPINEASADQAFRVDAVAVEDVRANVGAGVDRLAVQAVGDLPASARLAVELGPARREVLYENAVAVIAKGVEELPLLVGSQSFSYGLDDDLTFAFVGIEPFDVVNQLAEVQSDAGGALIALSVHAVDRDVDAVKPGFERWGNPVRLQQ